MTGVVKEDARRTVAHMGTWTPKVFLLWRMWQFPEKKGTPI